jgi:hypothetical protein
VIFAFLFSIPRFEAAALHVKPVKPNGSYQALQVCHLGYTWVRLVRFLPILDLLLTITPYVYSIVIPIRTRDQSRACPGPITRPSPVHKGSKGITDFWPRFRPKFPPTVYDQFDPSWDP